MRPQFKFTLTNDILGTQVISEPEGWAGIKINLERDPKFHSLIENFEVPLIFYGSGGGIDGGYNYIKDALALGLDELVEINIGVRYDSNDAYTDLFNGTIDLSTKKEIDFRKIQCAIIRDTIWAKFVNRSNTPVNLLSTVDVEDNPITPISALTRTLPSQKIRTLYYAEMTAWTEPNKVEIFFDYTDQEFGEAGILDLPEITADDIEERYTYFAEVATVFENFRFRYKTSIQLDVQVIISSVPYATAVDAGNQVSTNNLRLMIFKNWGESTQSSIGTGTKTQLGTNGVDGRTMYKFEGNIEFEPGETLTYVFGRSGSTDPEDNCYVVFNDFFAESTYVSVIADTLDVDTDSEVIQIGDAATSILRQITSENDILVSPYLLDPSECGYEHILLLGAHARGYTMTEKQFSMSFMQWWEGADPIMNLGLGYEEGGSPGATQIYIGKKSEFYDSEESVQLWGVNNIEIEFDQELLTKTVEVGFKDWDVEAEAGNDDPQTRKTYRTRYKSFGKPFQIISSFYAASAGIEETRRNRKESGKDWRLDEDIFIIATRNNATEVELFDGSPNGITGLLNSETRYNVRLTPARMMQFWLDFLSGQLYETYPAEKFYYARGEGNTEMSWEGDGTCAIGTLAEDDDQVLESDYLMQPELYTFNHYLTWDQYLTIRNNRKKAIGVNYIDHDGVEQHVGLYIKKLLWHTTRDFAEFTCWAAKVPEAPASPAPTPVFNLQAQYYENLPASPGPGWEVAFDNGTSPATFTFAGAGSDSDTMEGTTPDSVEVDVTKTSNGGVAEGNVTINYYKNGILMSTQTYLKGVVVASAYTYLGVATGDTLLAEILEYDYAEFIAKGTKAETTAADMNIVCMDDVEAGDLLVIQVLNIQDTVGNLSTPSGFTAINEEVHSWGTTGWYYKVAAGTESLTSINVSRTGSIGGMDNYMIGQIYQFRRDNITLAVESSDTNKDLANDGIITYGAITVSGPGRTLAALAANYDGTYVSTPSGYVSKASDGSSLISNVILALFTKENVSSDGAVTSEGSLNGWGSAHISIV
jgi:hypothetical protein